MGNPIFIAVLVFGFCLGGCDSRAPADTSRPATANAPAPERSVEGVDGLNETVMSKWSNSCALCHVTGNGGAPRVGHAEEWQARLAQGKSALMAHTIEGLNNMPPLGYCMSCEREDFSAMIDFMIGGRTGER